MARKPSAVELYNQRAELIGRAIAGRVSASGSSLSASYNLPVEQVRKILISKGVRDDD
jgi:hypothetical protein